ncbi:MULTISPECIES: phasin family protein [Chromohalobacter]|uniref:Phasin family protein n=5 Tax=Chromohalobacter TaxID=42054 RepID=A0A1Q8TDH2_9GAMM|nr:MULTISPECIES: phasin family protein [Chromohalobacter]NWO11581.1 phasin family protein [Chromohalobacter salexigens]CDQ35239.1 phasin family protein [Virgibacillus halodenitrificans]MCK0753909.1 phasin family protein [Chromohalobacter japonicus]MCK0766625.1 phasin family protein [Chromohalobacter beijerinckii]MCK2042987.1 phasin family protein [Chromohalobacter moromii]
MQDKMFSAFSEQTRGFFEPMRKFNGLMLDNMERMTEYQLDAMKRYSQLGVERMRAASEVKDAEDARDFTTQQADMLNSLSKQMLEDARAMADISLKFKADLEEMMSETGQQAADQASENMKAASEPAKAASNNSQSSSSRSSSTSKNKE